MTVVIMSFSLRSKLHCCHVSAHPCFVLPTHALFCPPMLCSAHPCFVLPSVLCCAVNVSTSWSLVFVSDIAKCMYYESVNLSLVRLPKTNYSLVQDIIMTACTSHVRHKYNEHEQPSLCIASTPTSEFMLCKQLIFVTTHRSILS